MAHVLSGLSAQEAIAQLDVTRRRRGSMPSSLVRRRADRTHVRRRIGFSDGHCRTPAAWAGAAGLAHADMRIHRRRSPPRRDQRTGPPEHSRDQLTEIVDHDRSHDRTGSAEGQTAVIENGRPGRRGRSPAKPDTTTEGYLASSVRPASRLSKFRIVLNTRK